MTSAEIISIILGILSLGGTGWGIIFGLRERKKRLAVEKKLKSQLWATLDRARYVIGDHILLREFHEQLTHPDKYRLWNVHQAASDLYISLVEHYLSQVDKFTYNDLKKLCDNGFIFWRWQEKQWRYLMCQRPENSEEDVPEFFTKADTRPYEDIKPSVLIQELETQRGQIEDRALIEAQGESELSKTDSHG